MPDLTINRPTRQYRIINPAIIMITHPALHSLVNTVPVHQLTMKIRSIDRKARITKVDNISRLKNFPHSQHYLIVFSSRKILSAEFNCSSCITRSPFPFASSLWSAYLVNSNSCLLYTSPSPRDLSTSRMPSSA